MTMIDKVAEMKNLNEQHHADIWSLGKLEMLEGELRDAAPTLLDILGHIQPGDAKRLAKLLRWQIVNDECSEDEIDMLDRLHEMCCKMEAKGK
jgi:hypothetical protein